MRVTTSRTGDTVGFDGLRAVVGAGEGVVGRFPGIVCVARCPDPRPLREFLALCASVGGADPGRALARRLATWMSGPAAPGPELRFGTVAAAGDQLAVFLVGAVEARVDGLGGLALSGAHAAIGTDRLFPHPRTAVVLSLDGGQVRADPADVHDLRAGVVPGAGVVLHPETFDLDDADASEGAALAGHEWFEAADPASDPLGVRPSWSPGVPAQRTGGRNGTTHAPGAAEDDRQGDSVTGPDPERGRGRSGAVSADLGPLDVEDADSLNGSHGGRHVLFAAADSALLASPSADPDDGSGGSSEAEPRDAGPYPALGDTGLYPALRDTGLYPAPGVAGPYLEKRDAGPHPAHREADAAADTHAGPYPADPPVADSAGAARAGDAAPAKQGVGPPAPDLPALDPRTGDPPGKPAADQGARSYSADLWAADPRTAPGLDDIPIADGEWPQRRADLQAEKPMGTPPADLQSADLHSADLHSADLHSADASAAAEQPVDLSNVDRGEVDPGAVRSTSASASDATTGTPTAKSAQSDPSAYGWAVDAPPLEGDGPERVHRRGAEDRSAAARVDLFTAPALAEGPSADRAHADPPPVDSVGADPSAALRTSPGRPAGPPTPGPAPADSLFAPAPAGAVRADPLRADPLRADPLRADPLRADPPSAVAAASVEQVASASANRSATGEPPADLFAVGPRVDGLPDAGPGAAIDHAAPPRPQPDPGLGRTRTDAEPAARIREVGSGRSAGKPGPSAVEATSTMPGLLFRPGGDATDAEPVSATAMPEVRPVPAAPDPARGGARIRGYQCENGHLNDPRSPTCRHCGATIDERAGGLVAGPRPPLGRLLFDDGAAHVVDGGYLVGRMPEVDDRVRTGELRPIVVEDRTGSVSRVHAEIRVSGWDVIVVDTGSRNGTYICGPNEGTWTALPPRRSRRLLPGARVRMGTRMFVFESSSTVR